MTAFLGWRRVGKSAVMVRESFAASALEMFAS
jgi:hypothetical protein